MAEIPIDPERLAALLDGRLDRPAQAELLDRLARSEADLEAYVDAAAALHELDSVSSQREGSARLKAARSWRRLAPARWVAIAAVLAGISITPWAWNRMRPAHRVDPGGFAVALGASGVPPGWDANPWGSVRGGEQPLSPIARAVRLGARLTDLELAVRARDSASSANLAADAARLLETVPAAGPVSALYLAVGRQAGAPARALEPALIQASTAAAKVVGPDQVAIGAWLEAARIAAARGDTGFFRATQSDRMLDRIVGAQETPQSARPIAERVRSALASNRAPDWSAVGKNLTELLGELGR